jgi:O-antigen/teichoic acid export membrane protein
MDTRLRRDIAWNFMPVVLLGSVGLGMNFLMAAWWGPVALAVFNLVSIAYFVFAVVGACGLQYAVLRAVAEQPDDRDRVAGVVVGALVPAVGLAGATTLLFLALRGPISRLHGTEAVATGMLWAAPGLFCFALNKVMLGVVNGLRRMRAFAIYTSLRYVLMAVGLGIAHAIDLEAARLALIWAFTEVLLLLVLVVELIATVSLSRGHGWTGWARKHLDFGLRGVLSSLAQEINSKLDVWMLGAVGIQKELVGIYSLAAALNEGGAQLAVAVQNNVNPIIARSLAEDRRDEVESLVHRTRRWFVPVMIGACTLGAVTYPYIVPMLVGDASFAAGRVPFAILMAGLALASPYMPFAQLLLMANRPGWHTVFLFAVAGINFAASLVLIPALGVSGAALSTSIAAAALVVFLRILARVNVRVRI